MIESIKRKSSPLQDQIDLIDKLNSVLENHPAGINFKLMIVNDSLDITADEVLIQELDLNNRKIVIRPIKISSLSSDTEMYEINKIDLDDISFIDSMKNEISLDASKTPKCLTSYNPKRHHYD